MAMQHNIKLSKSLSWLLRHGCEKSGLKLLKGGFLYVDDILNLPSFHKYTIADIQGVVANNNKQRFTLEQEGDVWKVRANQGHTLEDACVTQIARHVSQSSEQEGELWTVLTNPRREVVDLDLEEIETSDSAPVVIHGTSLTAWDSIKVHGLNCMGRNHIHFAPGEPGDDQVISGMRKSCQVWIYMDLRKALQDGLQFYRSSNNVILSEGDSHRKVDPYYFSKAVRTKTKTLLPFEPIRISDDEMKGDNSLCSGVDDELYSVDSLQHSINDLKL